jgi:hypothetical protein
VSVADTITLPLLSPFSGIWHHVKQFFITCDAISWVSLSADSYLHLKVLSMRDDLAESSFSRYVVVKGYGAEVLRKIRPFPIILSYLFILVTIFPGLFAVAVPKVQIASTFYKDVELFYSVLYSILYMSAPPPR